MDSTYNKFERPDNSKPVHIDVFIHFGEIFIIQGVFILGGGGREENLKKSGFN